MQNKINSMHVAHLGKICFNFSILGLVLTFIYLLLPFAILFALVIMAAVIILLPFIWLFSGGATDCEGVFGGLNDSSELILRFQELVNAYLPYSAGITIALSVLSIVFLLMDKTEKHTARIIISIVFAVLSVIAIIIFIAVPGGLITQGAV